MWLSFASASDFLPTYRFAVETDFCLETDCGVASDFVLMINFGGCDRLWSDFVSATNFGVAMDFVPGTWLSYSKAFMYLDKIVV